MITTQETTKTKQYWLRQNLSKDILAKIENADIIIVPVENFNENISFAFHQGAADLYSYLSDRLINDSIFVEICIDDDRYMELALHSRIHRISQIVVSYVAAPLVVGLLTNYIYDRLKASPSDIVEASIIVEDHQCRGFRFDYKGEAKNLNNLADSIGELVRKCTSKPRK